MTKTKSPKYLSRILRETSVTKTERLEEENRKLRLQVEDLREQVRKERRRADKIERTLAEERKIEANRVRWISRGLH